jgi:hypothetical protein
LISAPDPFDRDTAALKAPVPIFPLRIIPNKLSFAMADKVFIQGSGTSPAKNSEAIPGLTRRLKMLAGSIII